MQIITKDDIDFPAISSVLRSAEKVGLYSKDGKAHQVLICQKFVIVTLLGLEDKIAIKPSRSLSEAKDMAKQILKKEAERGSLVEFAETV